ncbi:transposable element Tcb1 transposase [Trichonephila clavipes]|nr:transposable element Tcb1 transposase [Trichonephila clavipes]
MSCELVINHCRPNIFPENWYLILVLRPIGGYQSPQVILATSVPPRGKPLSSEDANLYQDLVLPRASKPIRNLRDLLHAVTGLLRVTTLNEDRYLAVTAKRNRRSTASDLVRQLSSATGMKVSRQTVYRRLRHIGVYTSRPVRCVLPTATHCRLRLTWSREHALWTTTRVVLTDQRVQSVTMTGHIYRDVILEQHVRFFRGAMGAEFLFMDDNARPYCANIVDERLQSEDITRMD